jgi:hypothetical protein
MTTGMSQVSDDKLIDMLRDLLSGASPSGKLGCDPFVSFVSALGQGRGVAEQLEAVAFDTANKVDTDLKKVAGLPQLARWKRAYQIQILISVIERLASPHEHASLLPGNFSPEMLVSDLKGMLVGSGGMGAGRPQVLFSARSGKGIERRAARSFLVGVVHWRMGNSGRGRDEIWYELMGGDVDRSVLDGWMRAVDVREEQVVQRALDAGKAGEGASPYAAFGMDLAATIKTARTAQGRKGIG